MTASSSLAKNGVQNPPKVIKVKPPRRRLARVRISGTSGSVANQSVMPALNQAFAGFKFIFIIVSHFKARHLRDGHLREVRRNSLS
jgi:hypothetical protein